MNFKENTILKVTSILFFVEAIFNIGGAIWLLVSGGFVAGIARNYPGMAWLVTATVVIIAVLSLVMAALYILAGVRGLKGTNLKATKRIGLILLILSIVSLVSSIGVSSVGTVVSAIAGLVLTGLYYYGAKQALDDNPASAA